MNDATKIDYDSIRNDFVYGVKNESGALVFPDCEELAKKYGLTGQTIRRKVNREGWRQVRVVLKMETAAKADEQFRDKMAGELAKVDMLAFNVAVKGILKTQKGLELVDDADARAINCLAVAARVFQDIAHRAAGKVKKDFAAILKFERKTNMRDEKVAVEEIVQAVLKFSPDEASLDTIIAALEQMDEGEV